MQLNGDQSSDDPQHITNEMYSPTVLASNVLRNISIHLGTPVEAANSPSRSLFRRHMTGSGSTLTIRARRCRTRTSPWSRQTERKHAWQFLAATPPARSWRGTAPTPRRTTVRRPGVRTGILPELPSDELCRQVANLWQPPLLPPVRAVVSAHRTGARSASASDDRRRPAHAHLDLAVPGRKPGSPTARTPNHLQHRASGSVVPLTARQAAD
jgi:hypothetical protein